MYGIKKALVAWALVMLSTGCAVQPSTSTVENASGIEDTSLPLYGGGEQGCAYTQGYWQHSLEAWISPFPIIVLGVHAYTQLQLIDIFNAPAAGNGMLLLAHQLAAAKLNLANGADATTVAGAIADADAMIGDTSIITQLGYSYMPARWTSALAEELDWFNNSGCGDE
jgi:hypothetical protein